MSRIVATGPDETAHAEGLLSTADVAVLAKTTPRTVRRWARAGLLTPIRFGARMTRYDPADVRRLIESSTTNAAGANRGAVHDTRPLESAEDASVRG